MTPALRHQLWIDRGAVAGLDCVVFAPATATPSAAPPPVRIFLGTEASQWRAERVFLWSVDRYGARDRRYEVVRMADLPGFQPRGWTTGFTNYRFAIPDFLGGRGRAIYNDVDQIYLADPAGLFDLPMGGHGYLARSTSETSVMLLDGAAMQPVWNRRSATRATKKALHRRAAGARGALPAHWNARDLEHQADQPGVLHFTTLHTQPWRPFPNHFAYEPHPLASLWNQLEAEADAAGFELYTETRRGPRFAAWADRLAPPQPLSPEARSALEALASNAGLEKCETLDAAGLRTWLAGPRLGDGVEALGVRADWAAIPAEDLNWVLEALFRATARVLVLDNSDDDAERVRSLEARVEHVAVTHPARTWHLRSSGREGPRVRTGGPPVGSTPRVWVLRDDRAGNTTQARGLADALGWPAEEKALVFDRRGQLEARSREALAAPWPDLVIAAGQRNAAAARDIRRRAHGLPRLVQLGRKGGANADAFDLVVTPRAARLWPDPRRVETRVPLCAPPAAAGASGPPLFRGKRSRRAALLVGGSTGRLEMRADDVRLLGRDVAALAAALDAELWVTTSRRSPPHAAALLAEALPAAQIHAWRPDDPQNPYRALLREADLLIVTAESESMLAEAAATQASLVIAPVGTLRPPRSWQRLGERIVAHARRRPENERGTPLPQRGSVRTCARWVASGRVRPLRDLRLMHRALIEAGRAHTLADAIAEPLRLAAPVAPMREADAVARRVRALFGAPTPGTRSDERGAEPA